MFAGGKKKREWNAERASKAKLLIYYASHPEKGDFIVHLSIWMYFRVKFDSSFPSEAESPIRRAPKSRKNFCAFLKSLERPEMPPRLEQLKDASSDEK